MKILLTTHQFLPDFIGGTEVLTFEAARELQRRGHEVEVWTGYPDTLSGTLDRYIYEGVPVTRYHFNRSLVAASSDMMETDYCNHEFEKLFRNHLAGSRPDVIHFFQLGRLSATAVQAGADHSIPMLFTATDFWIICPTSHLRLLDNSLCEGPKKNAANCLRHLAALYGPKPLRALAASLPESFFSMACSIASLSRGRGKISRPVVSLLDRCAYIRSAMDRVARILVPTRMMRDTFVRNGYDAEKILLQPFGIPASSTSSSPKQKSRDLRVGFIGTLSEIKGPHVLIDAVSLLPKNLPLEVRIYGEALEYPEYGARVKRMAAADSRISCLGTFPNREIGKVLSELDVLVVPSLWYENSPLVVHSAQAAKVPVIASDIGGLSEAITHEINGLLFERGNARALAVQIRRLAEDRVLLKHLSAQARQPKSMADYVDKIEDLYKMILRERKQG